MTLYLLGDFLVNNYKQALGILNGRAALKKTMEDQGIESPDVFERWLEEEKAYLRALVKEPVHETLEMEYYEALIKLNANEYVAITMTTPNFLTKDRVKLATICNTWSSYTPDQSPPATANVSYDANQPMPVSTPSQPRPKQKRNISAETKLKHAQENVAKATAAVQDFEEKLGVAKRWVLEDVEWKKAGAMVNRWQYQRCLDDLERLIVSRMFELTKMNMSQTGELVPFACRAWAHLYDHRLQTLQTYCQGPQSPFASY